MPKQKFNTTDVAAEVCELRRLVVGSWLANIYDLDDKKTFLLKFSKSGGRTETGEGEKTVVLLESGARFHTTTYSRDRKADTPSKLNAKLRMHLKGKRLNSINQLGNDRCVEFIFGANETKHSLVLELYAQGNLVLLDSNDKILTLLRPVRDDKNGLLMLGNHQYDRTRFRARKKVTREELENSLAFGETTPTTVSDTSTVSSDTLSDNTTVTCGASSSVTQAVTPAVTRSPKTLREALCRAFGHSPQTADRISVLAGAADCGQTALPLACDENTKLQLIQNLLKELHALDDWLYSLETEQVVSGFVEEVVGETNASVSETEKIETEKTTWISESFSPFPFKEDRRDKSGSVEPSTSTLGSNSQTLGPKKRTRNHPGGFDKCVDEHFASLEKAADFRLRERLILNASKKAEKIKQDQTRRAEELERDLEREETKAVLIEYNLEVVDNVLGAVNALLATGQSWDDISRVIEDEKRAGNPVAQLVRKLDLGGDSVTVGLVNHLDDTEEGEEEEEGRGDGMGKQSEDDKESDTNDSSNASTQNKKPKKRRAKKSVAVTLDLSLSAYANARAHFDRKKKHTEKLEKTLTQNEFALKASSEGHSKKKQKDLKNTKTGMGKIRTAEWFEKFHWFITTENCLVLSARDAVQCDLLVKKYLGSHDAFIRADVPGAPATIVKAPMKRDNDTSEQNASSSPPTERTSTKCLVPHVSLAQAGAACLCRSQAWESRTVISAWWVTSSQVRKVTPDGDPLAPGVVWTVGQKNFLPPAPLVMGFSFVFLLETEEDLIRHQGDRLVKVLDHVELGVQEQTSGDSDAEREEKKVSEKMTSLALDTSEQQKEAPSRLDAFLDGSVDTTVGVGSADHGVDVSPLEIDEPSLDTELCDTDPVEADSVETKLVSIKSGSARISAAERRAMKKQRKKEDVGDDTGKALHETADVQGTKKPSKPAVMGKQSQQKPQPPQQNKKPLPRGKSGKAKRAAQKYAEQDDEDRELALKLLGVKGVVHISKQSVDFRKQSEYEFEEQEKNIAADVKYEKKPIKEKVAVLDSDDDEESLTQETRDNGDDIGAFLTLDSDRVKRVDWFTGCPQFEDSITHAIPMVAPFEALKQFAYKAKLTPGSQKKGKAAKTALDVVLKAPPSVSLIVGVGASKLFNGVASKGDSLTLKEAMELKAKKAERDAFLKSKISAAANSAAAGDLAQIMCGAGVKVSMPAGAAKAINVGRKGKK